MEEPFHTFQVMLNYHRWSLDGAPPSRAPGVPREEGSSVSSGSGGGGRGSDHPKFTVRSVLPAPPSQMKGDSSLGTGEADGTAVQPDGGRGLRWGAPP